MKIRINTTLQEYNKKFISYEELLKKFFDVSTTKILTVQYSLGKDGKQGTLIPRESVEIVDGMVFTVTNTNNA